MHQFGDSSPPQVPERKPFSGFLTTMLYGLYNFIESIIFNGLDAGYRLATNSLVKSLGVVALDVLSEIMIYVVLGLCCVFITIIIQASDYVVNDGKEFDEKKKLANIPIGDQSAF